MARTYSVQFLINGALSGQFASAMAAAQNAMRGLSNAARQVNSAMSGSMGALSGYLSRLNNIAASSSRFAQLSNTIKQNESALQSEINKARQLGAEYVKQRQQLQQCKAAMESMKATQSTLKSSYDAEKASLKGMRDSLKSLKAAYDQVKAAQGAGSAQAQSLKAQMEALKSSITSQQAKVQAAKAAYDQIRSAVRQAAQEFKTLEQAAKTSGSSFESAKARINSLKAALQQQKSQLESLKSSLSAAGFSTDHFVSSEIRLRSEIEATTRAIERQQQAAARLTNAQGRVNAASSDMSEAQSAFNTATSTISDMAAPVVEATQNAMTFEREMAKVKALTQMRNIRNGDFARVASEMAELTEEAERLGGATEFTSNEVAQAMGKYGMAGWNKSQIKAAMQMTVDLSSIAGDHNMMRTADVISDDAMAFGIQAGESYKLASGKVVDGIQYFGDAFAYAWTNANLDRESLHEAWKYNAPSAQSAGLSLGETLAQNMLVANSGIKGSMGGTTFRAGWTRFLAPPKTALKAMQEAGMDVSEATKQILESQAALKEAGVGDDDGLFDKIVKANNYYKTLGKNERAGWLKNLVGMTSLSGWQKVFDKGGIEEIIRIAKEIDSGAIQGWAKDTAAVMRDNTATSVEYLSSAFDKLQRSVGAAFLPITRSAADVLSPMVTKMAEWAAQNPTIIQGIVGIGAALAGVAVLVTGVALAFATWSFITAQIGMFTAGMAAVRAGMLATEVAGLGMAARLGAAFATLQGWIAGLSFSGVAAAASAAFTRIGAAIMTAARAALAFIATPLGAFLALIAIMAYVVYSNWEHISVAIKSAGEAISSALDGAGQAIDNLMAALGPVGSAISEFFSGIFDGLAIESAVDGIVAVFLSLVNIVAGVAVSIINIFSAMVNSIAELFTGLKETMSHALEGNFEMAGLRAKQMLRDVKAEWSNFDILKGDFGYDIGGQFRQQYKTYYDKKHTWQPPEPAEQSTQQAAAAQVEVPKIEVPQLDMSTAQNALNSFAQIQAMTPEQTQQLDISALQAQLLAMKPEEAQQIDVAAMFAQLNDMKLAAAETQSAQPQGESQSAEKLETSNVQTQLNSVGTGAQQAGQSLQQVNQGVTAANQSLQQLPQAVQPVQDAAAQIPAALAPLQTSVSMIGTQVGFLGTTAQTAGSSVGQLGTAASSAQSEVGQLGTAASGAQGEVGQLGTAAGGAQGNVGQLGTAAGGAAGQVGALGTAADGVVGALAAAAAKISSIQISAPTVVAAAPAANYKGGIYNKGAFLTWFAEKSPEAAIPLDKSARAISLWTQAGQMLGVLPSEGNTGLSIERPAADSTQRGINTLQREKMKRAREVYERIVSSMTQKSEIDLENKTVSNMATTVESVSRVQRSVQTIQAAQFDELGNIIGLNGAAGNVITKYDNDKIKHVKKAAQMKEYLEKQSQIEKATREVTKTAETIQSSSNTKWYEKISEKFSRVKESVKAYMGGSESEPEYEERDGVKVYKPSKNEPHILTERERYQSENPAKIKTQDRIKNSRSYQAIMNAQKNVNKNSTSILNRGELNTKIATDVTGGMFGQIFGTDFGLGQIMTQGKASGINPTEVMTSTFPNGQQAQSPNINPEILDKLPPPMTILPQSENTSGGIFGGLGNIFGNFDLGNILGGFDLGKIFGGLDIGEMFGKLGNFDVGSIFGGMFGNKAEVPAIMTNTSMVERLNAVENSERLESVESTMAARDYSAAAFQPTFHITVNVSGSGEKVDAKAIGEQIAYSARESFEKEYEKYRHEQGRRGYV